MKRDTQAQERDTLGQADVTKREIHAKVESGEPNRIRTCDPLIKSQLLYQLSYGPITRRFLGGVAGEVKAKNDLSGGIVSRALYRAP